MDILNDPLVMKYFRCGQILYAHIDWNDCRRCLADRVVESMQQPIAIGDFYLSLHWDKVTLKQNEYGMAAFHPYCLRLPDEFQQNGEKK